MTPAALSMLRESLQGCDLILFADIGSRTVLASNGRLTYPQEVLDALTDCAAELLRVAPLGAQAASDQVILQTPTGTRAFVRAPGDGAEALACLFAPGATITNLTQEIHAVFQDGTKP